MLDEIDGDQLNEWIAFDSIEPLGDYRDDVRTGIIAATIANVNRDPEQRKEAYSPADFMLWKHEEEPDEEEKREQQQVHAENMKSFIEMMNTAYGGKDARKPPEDLKPGP